MENMKYYLRFIALALCISFVACDDDEKATTAVFPELQELVCEVGDNETLTFDASDAWTLTSSALWCSFIVDSDTTFSCSGKAGHQTVVMYINDDATELMKSYKAELTLMMGGEQKVIYTVTRPVIGYELHGFNADQTVIYTEENPFIEDFESKNTLLISANVDWVVEGSDGLSINATQYNGYGLAGDKVTIKPELKSGHKKNGWLEHLTFKGRNGDVIATVPVRYEGIPADRLDCDNVNAVGKVITFSYQGWSYSTSNGVNGSESQEAPMPIVVAAKEDKYTKVYLEYTSIQNMLTGEYEYTFTVMSEDDTWLLVDDDKQGNLDLMTSGNQGKARNGYLMVFPKQVYDEVKNDFENKVLTKEEGVKKEYEEFIVASILQEGDPSTTTGFDIVDGMGNALKDESGEVINLMSGTDMGMTEEELIANYGTSNVYMLSLPLAVSYDYFKVSPRGYTGLYLSAYPEMDESWMEAGVGAEPGMLDMSILGLASGVNGEGEIKLNFNDPSTEAPYAILLISRY